MVKKCVFLLVALVFIAASAFSQTDGDYRTIAGGTWNTVGIWQRYKGTGPPPGRGWLAATASPTSADNVITIQSGHTVNVPGGLSITIDQVQVTGSLLVDANGSISIANGTPGINVNAGGIISISGTATLQDNATWTGSTISNTTFLSGSKYIHGWTISQGTVPLASWNAGSVTEIAGFTGSPSVPTITCSAAGNWSQSFYDFQVNLTGLTNSNRVVNFAGFLNSITNNFTVLSTGGASGGRIRMSGGVSNSTMNIGGNFSTSANTRTDVTNGATGVTLNINGNVTNSGTITMASTSSGICTLNVKGNVSNQTGGIITTSSTLSTATAGIGTVNFSGTSVQTFANAGTISNHVRFSIPSGSIVDSGTSAFSGTGTFTLGGELRTGAQAGLSTAAFGVFNGNTSGTKTFNANCTIHYNGSSSQAMGGLYPGAPAAGINVIINNSFGVTTSPLTIPATLITSIPGNLNLQSGTLTVSGVHTLQLDGTVSRTSGNIFMSAGSNLIINGAGSLGVDPFPFSTDQTFSNFSLNRSGSTVTLANNIVLNGTATLTNGTLAIPSVQLTLNGNIVVTGGKLSGDSNTILFIDGAGTVDVMSFSSGGNTLGILNINRSGSTVQFTGDYTISNTLNISAGTLAGGASVITMQGNTWSVSGGFFDPGTSTVIFDGNTAVTLGTDFNNVQLNAARTLDFPSDNVNISGNIDFSSGSVFNPSSGSVVLNGGSDQLINSNGTEFYTIQVNKGGGAVNTGSALSIQHLLDIQSLTDFNSNGNLTILSLGITTDLDGSIGPIPTGATVNGDVSVQRYMDPIGNTYRYLASPVNGALPPAIWGSTIYLYKYTSGTGSWSKHSTTSPLTLGAGYAVLKDMTTPITWSVTGPVSYGSFTWNFGAEGWYLIGNPFPSAIRWFDSPGVAWDLTNIATTIAVTDNSVSGYPNYFRYWSFNPLDNPNWGTGELANGMVSTGQAFWVYAGAGGGSLTIYEPAKENALTGEFYRTRPSVESNLLRISLDDGKLADVAYLKLNPKATLAYEFRYDLKKLKNEEMNLSLKDHSGNELVISSIDKLEKRMQIPLEIEVKEKGTFTLSFGSVESFAYGNSLYLIDTYEGKSLPVSGGTYSFSINESTRSYKDRFYLSLDNALPGRRLTDIIETYPNPVLDKLNICIPDNELVTIHLTDSQGKEFLSDEVRGSVEIDMHDYPKGMYVVRILTEEGIVVRKVVR